MSSGQFKKGDIPWNKGMSSDFDQSTYKTWWAMHDRCRNEGNKSYPDYGGRGIKVCRRWHKYENFAEDMGSRPEGLSLDRINSDGDYSPANCRWADIVTQNRNRKGVLTFEYNGRDMYIPELAELAGVSTSTMGNRLKLYGWSVERAVNTPLRKGV